VRMVDYATDRPLRQVGVLLTRPEAERLMEQLQALLQTGTGYARIEDDAWGDLDISLVEPETLHRRRTGRGRGSASHHRAGSP
jgi:hypothetical protein